MNLKECETRLADINGQISELLKERERVLKEWNAAFSNENKEKVVCVVEKRESRFLLFLVNGDSRLLVCDICDSEFDSNINDFYRWIHHSIRIHNMANHRELESPEWEKNLILAKVTELRKEMLNESESQM